MMLVWGSVCVVRRVCEAVLRGLEGDGFDSYV
jgi:hypothetical protein